ncbi:MAG: LacI family DNA-binding transcriptional regulator [Collinsella sp.]
MDKKNVSMNDVAIAAGVSLKTVSRVINEPDNVRESTRDKVHSAMEALGFRTNFAARSPSWVVTGASAWCCSTCRAVPWT